MPPSDTERPQPGQFAIEQALQLAIQHHQAERLQEAEALYKSILAVQPNHPTTNHHIGVLAAQMGNKDASLLHHRIAAEADPEQTLFSVKYGFALFSSGQIGKAEEVFRGVIQKNCNSAEVLNGLGVSLALQGRLSEAKEVLERGIKLYGDNAQLKSNLGECLYGLGMLADAEKVLREVLTISPEQPDALVNLGKILNKQDRPEEAEAVLRRALNVRPEYLDALVILGIALDKQERLEEAEAALRKALSIQPEYPEVLVILGIVLDKQERLEEAEAILHQALSIRPNYPEALVNLGAALISQERLEEAEAVLRRALSIRPEYPEALVSLGTILIGQDHLEEAKAVLRQALSIRPEYPDVLANLGAALISQNHLEEAEAVLRQALSIQPEYPEVLVNLGAVLGKQDRLEEAETALRQALGIRPEYPKALANLGAVLGRQDRLGEAEAVLRRALSIRPEYPEVSFLLAGNLLSQGNMEEGWMHYESRFLVREHHNPRRFSTPMWDGSPLEGKTVFIHAEHGLGDQIQMMRFIPLVKARGGKVIVEMWRELAPIFQKLPEIDDIASPGETVPPFDAYCPIMSLPRVLGTRLDNIPAPIPIHVDSDLRDHWARRLADLPGIKVGLVWAGNPAYKNDRNRSVPLFNYAPLADAEGVSLVSVQKGGGEAQLADCSFPIVNLGPEIRDFHDTAAILSNLDVLVSVDTSVAHLGGCLGVATWVLLPYASDWRWLREREDSPWYPSVRLFRQQKREGWPEVIERVALALSGRTSSGIQ